MTFTVAVLLEDLAYGGPEEGGWYFTCGEPANIKEFPNRRFKTRQKALGWRRKLQKQLDKENASRPSMSSVLSRGELHARIFKNNGYR